MTRHKHTDGFRVLYFCTFFVENPGFFIICSLQSAAATLRFDSPQSEAVQQEENPFHGHATFLLFIFLVTVERSRTLRGADCCKDLSSAAIGY